jgi:hypothetical protein
LDSWLSCFFFSRSLSFFSIIRYRLWDIDLVIRRTLLYAFLIGLLLLAYFVSVTLLQALFTAVSGRQRPTIGRGHRHLDPHHRCPIQPFATPAARSR